MFKALARMAMDRGYEITLEDRNVEYKSNIINTLAKTERFDTGLVLRACPPTANEEEA